MLVQRKRKDSNAHKSEHSYITFPPLDLRAVLIHYLKITDFSHCFSKERRANVTVSAVNDFASFLFCVLATVKMTLLIDMWEPCAVFHFVWIIAPLDACELLSSHTVVDKTLKQQGQKEQLLKKRMLPWQLTLDKLNPKLSPLLMCFYSVPAGNLMVSCVNHKEDADSHPEHFLMPAARKCACITQKSGSHRVTIRYATTERLCEIRWVMYTFSVTVSLKSLIKTRRRKAHCL